MNIIAHRGYWIYPHEQNKLIAFQRAVNYGFGIETDFRDYQGRLVISHDIPVSNFEETSDFISAYSPVSLNLPLAINIKSDGLHSLICEFINKSGLLNSFVFDMAIPDMKKYLNMNVSTFTRLSEYEQVPLFLDECKGIWLDSFNSQWFEIGLLKSIMQKKKELVLVSPELHNRNHQELWNFIKKHELHKSHLISLCTDFPKQARDFFDAKN